MKARKTKPTPPLARWLALECLGWAALIVVLISFYLHAVSTSAHQRALESRLKRWQTKYLLSESEVSRLRALEKAFHGTGNPFLPPRHSLEDSARHRQEIAALLPNDAAKRFLEREASDAGDD